MGILSFFGFNKKPKQPAPIERFKDELCRVPVGLMAVTVNHVIRNIVSLEEFNVNQPVMVGLTVGDLRMVGEFYKVRSIVDGLCCTLLIDIARKLSIKHGVVEEVFKDNDTLTDYLLLCEHKLETTINIVMANNDDGQPAKVDDFMLQRVLKACNIS